MTGPFGDEYAWGSASVIGLFAGRLIALTLFCGAETRAAAEPMRLFSHAV